MWSVILENQGQNCSSREMRIERKLQILRNISPDGKTVSSERIQQADEVEPFKGAE